MKKPYVTFHAPTHRDTYILACSLRTSCRWLASKSHIEHAGISILSCMHPLRQLHTHTQLAHLQQVAGQRLTHGVQPPSLSPRLTTPSTRTTCSGNAACSSDAYSSTSSTSNS
eukprot:scaffold112291_cov20-Tisochrysis_lutea.AAC.2